MLQTHYRSPIDFSAESLDASKSGLQRLIRAAGSISEEEAGSLQESESVGDSELTGDVMRRYDAEFSAAMDNDFNTAAAVSVLFGLADQVFLERDPSRRLSYIYALERYSDVLGLTLEDTSCQLDSDTGSGLIELVLKLRQDARDRKDYATSDLIRGHLGNLGIKVMDGADGATWERA